jgi:hypothetical protein
MQRWLGIRLDLHGNANLLQLSDILKHIGVLSTRRINLRMGLALKVGVLWRFSCFCAVVEDCALA